MIRAKIDIMEALKRAGYTSYILQRDKIFGSSRMTRFRRGESPSIGELDKLCDMLHCQPGDIIEHVRDNQAPGP